MGQGPAAGRLTVLRFDDIGDRLKAFRLGSGLTADEIAKRIGISRTALYRFEKGEVAKIETLEKLAELLDVSVPTLLGVGVEYVSQAVSFFERLRQIEETSEHITVLAGPVSLLLASNAFDDALEDVLTESIPADLADRAAALREIADLMPILRARKATYRTRKPGILNLISGAEIDRFLRNGLVGRLDLPEDVRARRRARARAEAEHLAGMMADAPIGVQIGIVPGTLPHMSFQIFRQPDRKILALSPFRLGEQPNVLGGIAMITSAPEALSLHERAVEDMWRRALKGQAAADFLRQLIARHPA
ncbi:MAG: helix-turn-helix transcriptional regulator [Alphaproteobacteria bacterium]|nr:helix-turn-helix transcriptional regulator [Alphaproteobacteria bacterium]